MTRSLCFFVVLLLASALSAQDDYVLNISSVDGTMGESADVTITLDNTGEEVSGYQFGVCHRSHRLDLDEEIAFGSALDDISFTTHTTSLEDGPGVDDGFTIAAVIDPVTSDFLPVEDELELYVATYFINLPGLADVEFCETLGDPEVALQVTVDGVDIVPATVDGMIDAVAVFLRGDVDLNGRVEPLADGFRLYGMGFKDGFWPECWETVDLGDDDSVSFLFDGLWLLDWGFSDEEVDEFADPGPTECGPDPVDSVTTDCPTAVPCWDVSEPTLNEDYSITISDAHGVIDGAATVTFTVRSDEYEMSGFQWSVCHDESVSVDIEDIVFLDPDDLYGDPNYDEVRVHDDGGWSVGMLFNSFFADRLETGEDHDVYEATYQLGSEPGDYALEFCALGNDRYEVEAGILSNRIDLEVPELFEGEIEIRDKIFLRGDVDGDGQVLSILDAFHLLEWAFIDGPEPPCMDAADIDDDGQILALVEAIELLGYGFTGGDSPPPPGVEDCGPDPDGLDDGLDCLIVDGCY